MYDGNRSKERGLNWDGVEREEYPTVAAFLDQATDPEPEKRFASSEDAKRILSPHAGSTEEDTDESVGRAIEPKPESVVRKENEVQWLRSLLQSYPGSRWGNSETRGLDTEFATQTYVETNLERSLFDQIRSRQVRLVVLCGNAGDGKTALLQRLASRLGFGDHTSSERILRKQMDDGLTVSMNLDGSASWQHRSADDLLDESLAPFQNGPPEDDIVHLLAINDGRLLEWMDSVAQIHGGDTSLTKALTKLLNGEETPSETYIRFIDLNHRSLVGGVNASVVEIDTGFLDELLFGLYGGKRASEIWAPCETCSAENRCEVRRAMRLFGPDGLPGLNLKENRKRAKQRLIEMLQAVHLRGETHITVRELRASLVYILFGVHYCCDYHNSADDLLPYWDRAFSPESPGRQGDVLRELVRFDPSLEAHPQIDRHLLRLPSVDLPGGASHYPGMTLSAARRRAYFEWTKDDIVAVASDPNALALAQARHYLEFKNLPTAATDREELCRKLCEGIAHLENLPFQALGRPDVVPLRITPRTPTETAFWVEKPLANFRLEADIPAEADGLDRLHRQAFLIYEFRNGAEESLRLGAELFSLLMELSEGFQLGDVSTDDTFAHLSIFVQRLVREDDRRIMAWNPIQDERIYDVSADVFHVDTVGVQQLLTIRGLEETRYGQ